MSLKRNKNIHVVFKRAVSTKSHCNIMNKQFISPFIITSMHHDRNQNHFKYSHHNLWINHIYEFCSQPKESHEKIEKQKTQKTTKKKKNIG
eukprot:1038863_1